MHALTKLLGLCESGLETRAYSGRAMYGKDCLAVTGDLGAVIGAIAATALHEAASFTSEEKDEIALALRYLRTDAMGRDTVVYFPTVAFEEEGGALEKLQAYLTAQGVESKIDEAKKLLIAGATGHVIRHDGHLYQVEDGPTFLDAEDCAEAIASSEENDL